MAWFDRMKKKEKEEDLPKELEGKTIEEVVRYIKVAEELGAKVTTLQAERDAEKTAVATMSNQFQEVKNKLAATEANLNKLQNPPNREEPADFLTDPEKAIDQRMAPLLAVTVNNASLTARLLAVQTLDNEDMVSPTDARTMNGRLFRAWEAEIQSEAAKYPAGSMAQPQNWIGLFYMVKGRHSDELSNPETRKKKYNFIESASQSAPPSPPAPKDGAESLTDQEKHVADKMHVSYGDYAKRKKGMQFIGG
jgi:hypothetical protein